MNDDECAELLQHARVQVRSRGRADLDVRALERASDRQGARAQLLGYLEALRVEILLQSSHALREAMQIFTTIPTSDGGPIRGVVVEIQPEDQRVFGTDHIDLVGSPQLDDLLNEVDQLLADVRDDGE